MEQRTLLNSYFVTNTNNSGAGSLRQALLDANANSGLDSITFDIPGGGVQTIAPTFALPQITDPLKIDATTQPGYGPGHPAVELTGALAGNSNGLEFVVGGNTVSGLDIHSFGKDGIVLAEAGSTNPAGGNVVANCFIGTDPTGELPMPNVLSGVHLVHSPHNDIEFSLLSANGQSGVFAGDKYSTDNHIFGNLIGTDASGMTPLGNGLNGVALGAPPNPDTSEGFASLNLVGGTDIGQRNVISGNKQSGIWIGGGADNRVQGNYIGVAVDGKTPLPNGTAGDAADPSFGIDGVYVVDGSGNEIGGLLPGAGNLISANARDGVRITAVSTSIEGDLVQGNLIGTDLNGQFAPGLGNVQNGVTVRNDSTDATVTVSNIAVGGSDEEDGATDGNVQARNVISGNIQDGVLVVGDRIQNTLIEGNYIGTDRGGTKAVNNGANGVEVAGFIGGTNGPSQTRIGDEQAGAGNVISGNDHGGVVIGNLANGSLIRGNLIGTTADGLGRLGNGTDGIDIANASDNTVGGTNAADLNVISGNSAFGVSIVGSATGAPTSGNVVAGNYIGTDLTGNRSDPDGKPGTGDELGNQTGVSIVNASGNVIGLPSAALHNVISGNVNAGVALGGALATHNVIQANIIGVGSSQITPVPNAQGVVITQYPGEGSASDNVVGGTADINGFAVQGGNLISGNAGPGVVLRDGVFGNIVSSNSIGTDFGALTAIPNAGDGIAIADSPANVVGGTKAADANVIANNGSDGVYITGTASAGNIVEGNDIGIDLLHQPKGNIGFGVEIVNAPSNSVGGTVQGAGNNIGANVVGGVHLTGSSATSNLVLGNTIGDPGTGAGAPVGNGAQGVLIDGGASANIIGTPGVWGGNVISGNSGNGITILGIDGAQSNVIQNNYVGVGATGLTAVANLGNGIYIENSPGTVIGGDATQRNVISGNSLNGITLLKGLTTNTLIQGNYIGTDKEATSALPNQVGVYIGYADTASGASNTSILGNVIAGNSSGGVFVVSNPTVPGQVHDNTIQGNYIGTNPGLITTIGNHGYGILVSDSPGNRIGSTSPGLGNVVAFTNDDNNQDPDFPLGQGIEITGPGSQNNRLEGNRVVGNLGSGIRLSNGATLTVVGTPLTGGGNVIIANHGNGISVTGQDTAHNTIQNNLIGLDETGAAQGNLYSGVLLFNGAHDNTIGGSGAFEGNVISANREGVFLNSTSHDDSVLGNRLGTDRLGVSSPGLANTNAGVVLSDSHHNIVGGETDTPGTGAGNTIFGSTVGIGTSGAASTGNVYQGNLIEQATSDGVSFINNASNNLVGGTTARSANRITHNGRAGVFVDTGTGNAIRQNQILNNAGLGIDLAPEGVTPNDAVTDKDADTGPNNLQNAPDLIGATTGNSHRIVGTLDSAPDATYTLEFFTVAQADPSGYGEGDVFLVTATVTTNHSGVATFDLALPASAGTGTLITATATDAGGNTSEFSNAIAVQTDSDGDGIGDDTENARGDGNGDGIPDAQQANVASFPDAVSGQFITLQAPDGLALGNVRPMESPSPDDAPSASFDLGFFSFSLSGLTPGGAANVEVFLPGGSTPQAYDRYGPLPGVPGPVWYGWAYNGKTGAQINGSHVTLHFIDGQLGDDDLTADGTIVDPGGPAFPVRFTVTNTNDSGPGSLRQAILDANAHPGNDRINFHIDSGGVQTIMPLSPLPNITDGVTIDGTTQPGFAGKPIVELDGEKGFGSGLILSATGITVRGLVINRFSEYGIAIFRAGSSTPYNFDIEGNYIGTDVTGTIARGNEWGIWVGDGNGMIGGDTPAAGNVISGNFDTGISVSGSFYLNVWGNRVGVAADGVSPLGNGGVGVEVSNVATSTIIGGLDPSRWNVIAFNASGTNDMIGHGVEILGNSIYSNKVLGIAGGGLNDDGLNDGSSSSPQNYPVLSSALSANGQTMIAGHLNSRPNQTYLLQFYANPTTTLSGYGQGKTFLGSSSVTTDASGHADFSLTLAVDVPSRQLITATATDVAGNTSAFSLRLAVNDVLGNVYVVNTTDDTDDGVADAAHTSLREAILAANNHPGPDTILFDIPGSGVQTIAPTRPLPGIIDSVVLDATSQPGYAGTPLIQLVGTSMERNWQSGSPVELYLTGLYLQANNSTIRGFDINSFYEFATANTWGGRPLSAIGDGNVIDGNFFGTDPSGTKVLENLEGPAVSGTSNRVGGTAPGERNLFAGGFDIGLSVSGTDNLIEGNLIGTDITGTQPLPNGHGVAHGSVAVVVSGAGNLVGGTAPGAGNVISGNLGDALEFDEGEGSFAEGNLIGTDVTGTLPMGNQGVGIVIRHYGTGGIQRPGTGVIVGGAAPGAGNVISNNRDGIDIIDSVMDVVEGNRIGTDLTGTLNFGNGNVGIFVTGTGHQIGAPGAGNVIAGNHGFGIFVTSTGGSVTTGNVIQGNLIGTAADGISPLGNGSDGIAFSSNINADSSGTGPSDCLVGGLDAGDGNVIAYNGRNGINVLAGQQIGIVSNLIYANGALAIDLNGDGVTPNDTNDADTGDNGLQNFPTFSTAFTDGSRTQVEGNLNSTPNTVFLLQFFTNPAADPSGFGEGQILLGSHYVTTDAAGNASFAFTFATAVPGGQFISATATDPLNETSELAADVPVTTGTTVANRPPTANAGGPYTINEGDGLTLNGSQSDDPDSDPLTYTWDVNRDGVFGDATGAKPTLTWAQLQALGIVNGPSSFDVRVRVDDGQGHVVTSAPVPLSVLNVSPVADAGPDLNVTEGDTVKLTGTFTDPGTADTHTLSWHVDASNGQVIADGSGATFGFVPVDNGLYTVTFAVTDSDGATGTAVVQVNVYNAPPTATVLGLPSQGTVGVPIDLSATVTDASPIDAAAGFRYYWEAVLETDDNVDYWVVTPGFTFTPPKPGTYDIYFDATDKDGGTFRYYNTLDVVAVATDTAPTVTLGANATINEGSAYSSSGSFADPDASDAWTGTVNYGDGTGDQPLALNSDKTFALGHVYADNGGFDVTVTITDTAGLSGTQKTHVTVNNVAPVVTLGVPSPVVVGSDFSLGGSFTDPGADTWTATVDYGDNSGPQPLALATDKTFTLHHVYQTAGSFAVTVTVTDKDGGAGRANVTAVVNKNVTSLVAAPASATYGGTATLTATLTADGNPLAGEPLLFQINGVTVGTADTDASGIAALSNLSLGTLDAGSATISVSYAGDPQNGAGAATSTLTIAKAPLVVTVNNASRVYGQANPTFGGNVTGVLNSDGITATYSTAATSTSGIGSYPITATLADPNSRLSNYIVTINNGTLAVLATTLAANGVNVSTQEGSAFSGVVATFSSNNPIAAAGDFAATIHWGDGHTSAGTVLVAAGGGFQVTGINTYAGHGTYPISILIQDNAGQGSASTAAQASVADVAPAVSLGSPTAVTVGAPFTLAGSFSDPGANTWTASVDYGDNSGPQPLALAADKTFTLSHTYASAGNFTVTVTVTDDAGAFDTASVSETVNKLQTSLAVASTTATYGGTGSLSASLTASGNPLPGKMLVFSLNGMNVGSAATDASGTAVLPNVSLGTLAAGSATIAVSFAGDGQDTAATATATLSIARAPLMVTVASSSRVYGQGNPALAGTITGIQNGDPITATYSTLATATSSVGSYPIIGTLNDPSGRLGNYAVTVNNGTLTVLKTTLAAVGQNVSASEGSAFSGVVATFTTNNPIATAGDFAVTVNWGNGLTSAGTVSALAGGGFQVAGGVIYADNGVYPLSISIHDNAGQGATSANAQAMVANVAPTPSITGLPASAPSGSPISITGSATDPSPADTAPGFVFGWTVTRTQGGVTTQVASGTGPSFSFTPVGAGVYTVTLTATDKDGGTATTSGAVTVTSANVAPVVSITGPAAGAVFPVNKPVTFTGTFTDPDSPGPHTAIWTLTAPGQPTITLPGVVSGNRVTATYTFRSAGIYQVSLSVTDDQGATGRASTVGSAAARAVVYDVNAGKITGGGWFDSPAGAYAPDPRLAGKVNLGFNAQYKPGNTVPTGQLEFNAGAFNFHSTAYNWLVVTGNEAQLQGTGTANGHTYAFLLTMVDGRGAAPDRNRLEIWDPLTGVVVYDNQPGANDGSDPLTTLGGGQATIHP